MTRGEVIVTRVPQYVAEEDQQTQSDPEILRQQRNKRRAPWHMACGGVLIMTKSILMLTLMLMLEPVPVRGLRSFCKRGKRTVPMTKRGAWSTTRLDTLSTPEQSNWKEVYKNG